MATLVLTIVGPDRTGLVDSVAEAVANHGGNWMESRMAHLGGKFAGILRVSVPDDKAAELMTALEALSAAGLRVIAEEDAVAPASDADKTFSLHLVGSDRPGIVREVTHILALKNVNVEEFETKCTAAPMSGGLIFHASAQLRLPPGLKPGELRDDLEQVAHDMMVDITLNSTDE